MRKRNPLKAVIKKEDRFGMAHKIAGHKHDAAVVKLWKEVQAVGLEIYYQAHKGMLKQMNELPEGWLNTVTRINFRAIDDKPFSIVKKHYSANDNGSKVYGATDYVLSVDLPKALPRLSADTIYRLAVNATLVAKHAEATRAYLLEYEERQHCAERMETFLEDFRTFEKLYEAWPEVRELVKNWEPIPELTKPQYPVMALDTQSLNDEFGLPTKVAA